MRSASVESRVDNLSLAFRSNALGGYPGHQGQTQGQQGAIEIRAEPVACFDVFHTVVFFYYGRLASGSLFWLSLPIRIGFTSYNRKNGRSLQAALAGASYSEAQTGKKI